ncbi:TPA: RelA/SpoT domain-containing protein [Vibrio vulnificus]|nr:RelA/SpoT domain-containing protein [Vibrio vulnificus]
MNIEVLKIDYDNHKPDASRFMVTIIEQLSDLIEKNGVTLGTQIESRVKSFQSIEEKIKRKSKVIQCVTDFDDFVGIRVVVLFKSDIDKTCELIKAHFKVVDEEDVSRRLETDQFGYQSTHYTVKLPKEWLKVPTLAGLDSYKAEIQVRTLSQHIWAVASHKLQYKQESNVPTPVKRSINRVSALLETVDLEFERVLAERETYISQIDDEAEFNVDVLEALCDRLLPRANKDTGNENYSWLYSELEANGINSAETFTKMIEDFLPGQIAEDRKQVDSKIHYPDHEDLERLQRGVFYTHVGLVRGCIEKQAGKNYRIVDEED